MDYLYLQEINFPHTNLPIPALVAGFFMRGRMGGMEVSTTSRSVSGFLIVFALSGLMGVVGCVPWFEEAVVGSHHTAAFYRQIGLDAPLTWIADTFERLH